MRAKYKPLVAYVGDRQELMNLINEMIGELNASHTGASAGGGGRGGDRAGVADAPPRPRARRRRRRGPLQGRPRLRGRAGRQGLDQGREGQLPDRHRRQAAQGRRRLLRAPRPPAQPQGRADAQHQARATEGAWKVKYEPISLTAYANLRYERWVKERRELVDKLSDGRVGYLHIKAMDPPSLAQVQEGAGRVPPQGGAGHRRALERRRQHRAGAAGDPGPAPLPGLAAPRHRADPAAVRRLLRPEGRAPELAERLQRRDVPRRLPRPGAGQGRRHPDDGRRDRHGQLFAHRRLDASAPPASASSSPTRPRTNMENTRRQARRLRREHPRGQPRRPRPPARGRPSRRSSRSSSRASDVAGRE